MPKVYLNERKRKEEALRRYYRSKKAECDITDRMLADALGISVQAVSKKMKLRGYDQTNISFSDVLTILKITKATEQDILSLCRL